MSHPPPEKTEAESEPFISSNKVVAPKESPKTLTRHFDNSPESGSFNTRGKRQPRCHHASLPGAPPWERGAGGGCVAFLKPATPLAGHPPAGHRGHLGSGHTPPCRHAAALSEPHGHVTAQGPESTGRGGTAHVLLGPAGSLDGDKQ